TAEEKERQIAEVQALQARQPEQAAAQLQGLQETAVRNQNMFAALMEAVKVCSLGQITGALYAVGGQYRRNM
ncbi:MAG: methylmalonyl-CoA mutase, partial [Ardenticatenaceae bacterium]|nr:methylmalonyl-CoA mutase [Ardenticatenaceae bacterium]